MAAFDSDAFSTDAFSEDAFDFGDGGEDPETVINTRAIQRIVFEPAVTRHVVTASVKRVEFA